MKPTIAAALLAMTLSASAGNALAAEEVEASALTTTVWLNGKGQESMAKKLNELHREMNAQGWRFEDLDLYIENGDMQGFFVTYIREAL